MKKIRHRPKYIIGIDEVGRGALAGPVTVAAVILSKNFQIKIRVNPLLKNKNPRQSASIIKLKDSKKLSPRQREIWFKWIKKHSNILQNVGMLYATANVSPKIIDKINISQAANLAATRALNKLFRKQNILASINGSKVFLDGGLYLSKPSNSTFARSKSPEGLFSILNSRSIIKGDEKIPAIMLASIVAKVSRDSQMIKLHKKYPRYGFNQHKGYGTKQHLKAIRKYGHNKIHRLTFLRKIR